MGTRYVLVGESLEFKWQWGRYNIIVGLQA